VPLTDGGYGSPRRRFALLSAASVWRFAPNPSRFGARSPRRRFALLSAASVWRFAPNPSRFGAQSPRRRLIFSQKNAN